MRSSGPRTRSANGQITAISALFDNMDAAENRAMIQEHFGTLKSSADLLASASLNVATPVADYHSSTVEVGEGIKSAMSTFAWAVGLLVTGAIVGAIFSFGGSLAVGGGGIAVGGGGIAVAVSDTIATIRGLYTSNRLFQILKITLVVGPIEAFGKVPDLTSTITELAAIIAMKASTMMYRMPQGMMAEQTARLGRKAPPTSSPSSTPVHNPGKLSHIGKWQQTTKSVSSAMT